MQQCFTYITSLEHAPFPKVIRLSSHNAHQKAGLEHAPFPKVIRCYSICTNKLIGLEHAPFPKVIRWVRW